MKAFLIKYLYLSYTSKIFGVQFTFLRASTVIVPAFVLAILASLYSWGALFWIPFTALILLTFPIVKDKYINWAAIGVTFLIAFTAIWYDHAWYEGLPFLYFALGFLVYKTQFIFPVQYGELQDWHQQLQYLLKPDALALNDDTEPVGITRKNVLKNLTEALEKKFGTDEQFVNWIPFVIPIASKLILILILLIRGAESF